VRICIFAKILEKRAIVAAQGTRPIQETFLKHLRDNRIEVTVFLVTGIRLQGRIKRLDSYTVELARGDSTQIIYKHAISAINPAEPGELRGLTHET
jgi:host factor-I protein